MKIIEGKVVVLGAQGKYTSIFLFTANLSVYC